MSTPPIYPCVKDPACNTEYNGHSAHCLRSYGDGIRAQAKAEGAAEAREQLLEELLAKTPEELADRIQAGVDRHVETEREACAKLLETEGTGDPTLDAAAIRARGEKKP